ncbi:hypothetical protein ABGT18_24430 [Pseudomonas putida]|uniref:hypothetical protein n=1 Tax=Pseudomonas putida TaxID=303 RepID=UPI002DB69605|nr:hypothetical protein [Pseudomonas putida]WRW04555.1 hypothetical protein VPZ82_03800 [Pseudomonas putida]
MLIPPLELKDSYDHHMLRASCENSLDYQLRKVLHITKEVEKGLDAQAKDRYWYVADEMLSYNLDALIHNLSILTEYYHSWVVFCFIGTNSIEKTKYRPLKKDKNLNAEIDKIFKSTSIGVLKSPERYRGDFQGDCKKAFMKAYDFLFIGKFYEVYVLNNYLKHNAAAMKYAPKAIMGNREISVPYIYIGKPNDRLLNSSVFKSLIDCEFDGSGKTPDTKDDYFLDIINATIRPVCSLGGYKVYNINDLDYLKGSSHVGLPVESIVELAHELFSNISKVFIDGSKRDLDRESKLNRMIDEIKTRTPKTLTNLVKS